jgi:hypothetical protein
LRIVVQRAALKHLHRFEEALHSCEAAVALAPDFASGQWNRSLMLLLLGDLQAGFAAYHSRWQTDTFAAIRRSFSQPVWLGAQDIRGATLLLHTEQGLGDTIQFARYAQLLADRGARVVLEVEPALFDLMQSLAGVAVLVRHGDGRQSVERLLRDRFMPLPNRAEEVEAEVLVRLHRAGISTAVGATLNAF